MRTSQPVPIIASEISAAAIEWGAKAEKRTRPAVAVCWPRRDHRSLFGAWEEVVGGFASDLNRVVTQEPDLELEQQFLETARLGKPRFFGVFFEQNNKTNRIDSHILPC